MLEEPAAAALLQCAVRESTGLERVLGAEQVLATIDQYHQMILAIGQRLGAVRTDLPLARLSMLSRAIGAVEDQAFGHTPRGSRGNRRTHSGNCTAAD